MAVVVLCAASCFKALENIDWFPSGGLPGILTTGGAVELATYL